jgi:hypothetical protein
VLTNNRRSRCAVGIMESKRHELLWQIDVLERMIASPSTPPDARAELRRTLAEVKRRLKGLKRRGKRADELGSAKP